MDQFEEARAERTAHGAILIGILRSLPDDARNEICHGALAGIAANFEEADPGSERHEEFKHAAAYLERMFRFVARGPLPNR